MCYWNSFEGLFVTQQHWNDFGVCVLEINLTFFWINQKAQRFKVLPIDWENIVHPYNKQKSFLNDSQRSISKRLFENGGFEIIMSQCSFGV